jgi:hypothetical protein
MWNGFSRFTIGSSGRLLCNLDHIGKVMHAVLRLSFGSFLKGKLLFFKYFCYVTHSWSLALHPLFPWLSHCSGEVKHELCSRHPCSNCFILPSIAARQACNLLCVLFNMHMTASEWMTHDKVTGCFGAVIIWLLTVRRSVWTVKWSIHLCFPVNFFACVNLYLFRVPHL